VTKFGGWLIVGQDVIGKKLVLVAKFNCNKRYSKNKVQNLIIQSLLIFVLTSMIIV
jgi:hypothetical protein